MRYRFVLQGAISRAALKPAQPVSYEVRDDTTRLEIDVVDDAHLQGVIELLQRIGAHVEQLQELDVFKETEAPSSPPSGD
jgi:hypothetical protein